MQNLASIQPRTSLVKFARSPCTDPDNYCYYYYMHYSYRSPRYRDDGKGDKKGYKGDGKGKDGDDMKGYKGDRKGKDGDDKKGYKGDWKGKDGDDKKGYKGDGKKGDGKKGYGKCSCLLDQGGCQG